MMMMMMPVLSVDICCSHHISYPTEVRVYINIVSVNVIGLGVDR